MYRVLFRLARHYGNTEHGGAVMTHNVYLYQIITFMNRWALIEEEDILLIMRDHRM